MPGVQLVAAVRVQHEPRQSVPTLHESAKSVKGGEKSHHTYVGAKTWPLMDRVGTCVDNMHVLCAWLIPLFNSSSLGVCVPLGQSCVLVWWSHLAPAHSKLGFDSEHSL